MDRDFLDLSEKSVDPGTPGGGGVPFPGNINTMDPFGLDSLLWTDVSDALGMDFGRLSRDLSGIDAVGLSLAMQCGDVQARDLAKADMALWRRDRSRKARSRQYSEVDASEHWLARMLSRRPSEFHTWGQFWRMVGLHLTLAQNAYIVKEIQRDGTVTGLIPVQPTRVREKISTRNRLYYEIKVSTEFERAQFGLSPDENGKPILLPADRVIHIKGRLWNGLRGLSNIDAGKPIFRLLKAIAAYQENLFGNNGTVLLAFETDQQFQGEMADAAFNRLKRQLTERVRKGAMTGDPILLEAGLKAKQIAVNAREALTQDAFNGLVMRVCGLMMTPPHKIMAYETVKYENMAAADNQYANDTLIPLAKNIEESLRFGLLDDDELDALWPEFDRMALMAGDMRTLGEVLDKAMKNGVLKVNEYRDLLPLSLNPIPGGEVRHVPVNTAMVDDDGTILAQTATGQPEGTGQGGSGEPSGSEDPADQPKQRSLRIVHTSE